MKKISILDNDPVVAKELCEKIEQLFPNTYEVFQYTDEKAYLAAIKNRIRCDITFIDILLTASNGIQVGLKVNLMTPGAVIIFISEHPEYQKSVYDVRQSFFLSKPFKDAYLKKAIAKAESLLEKRAVKPRSDSKTTPVNVAELVYIANEHKHCILHYADGSAESCPTPLAKLKSSLPPHFLLVHQSYCINKRYIEIFAGDKITMFGGAVIPVSRRHIKELRQNINELFGETTV